MLPEPGAGSGRKEGRSGIVRRVGTATFRGMVSSVAMSKRFHRAKRRFCPFAIAAYHRDSQRLRSSQLSGREYTVPSIFIANMLDDSFAAMPMAPIDAPPLGSNAPRRRRTRDWPSTRQSLEPACASGRAGPLLGRGAGGHSPATSQLVVWWSAATDTFCFPRLVVRWRSESSESTIGKPR
jgi:hypothetical protein